MYPDIRVCSPYPSGEVVLVGDCDYATVIIGVRSVCKACLYDANLGLVQTSHLTCAESNANELKQ
jgi:hypothetical protein